MLVTAGSQFPYTYMQVSVSAVASSFADKPLAPDHIVAKHNILLRDAGKELQEGVVEGPQRSTNEKFDSQASHTEPESQAEGANCKLYLGMLLGK